MKKFCAIRTPSRQETASGIIHVHYAGTKRFRSKDGAERPPHGIESPSADRFYQDEASLKRRSGEASAGGYEQFHNLDLMFEMRLQIRMGGVQAGARRAAADLSSHHIIMHAHLVLFPLSVVYTPTLTISSAFEARFCDGLIASPNSGHCNSITITFPHSTLAPHAPVLRDFRAKGLFERFCLNF